MKKRFIINIAALCTASSLLFAGEPGTTGMNFLKMGVGAREIGMAGAASGWVDDINAAYWNPAGLAQLQQQQAGFMHTQWFEDITYQYASYARPTRKSGTFAVSIYHFSVDDFQGFDWQGGKTPEPVSAGDDAFSFSWAYETGKLLKIGKPYTRHSRLFTGINLKYAQETLDTESASAFIFDFGMLYHTPIRNLRSGLVVQNIGSKITFVKESGDLPQNIKLGIAYKLFDGLTLASDMNMPNDNDAYFTAGCEYSSIISNNIAAALRAGFRSNADLGSGIHFGFGLKFKKMQFDYAYSDYDILGNTQHISFTLLFGAEKRTLIEKEKKTEKLYMEGINLLKEGKYIEAIAKFNTVLSRKPGHKKALEKLREASKLFKETRKKQD